MVVVREYYYVILIILCSNDILCQGVPKPLTVLLRSNWGHTPPLLEASEFFWDYDQTLFWNFVNATKSLYSDSTTDKVAYELVAEEAERLLPPSVYNVLLFSLALHAYSPAVQLFYQVSEEAFNKFSKKPNDCNGSSVFVDVSGDLACTIGEVHDLIRLEEGNLSNIVSPPIDTFEHHFPSSVVDRGILVFLYGELGTPEFANMHSALSEMASGGKIQYIFRHYVKQTSSQRMLLSGFGVELSVKSTEYKAVDDSEVKGDGPQVVASKEEEEELRDVSGFIFSILKSRHPGLKPDLKDFEAHLLQGAREMPELKLWQLQDLGFQAAQRVVAAGQEYGLTMLKEISQNLPMQAKMLYKIQVDKALRKEIEANQKVLSTIGVMPGSCVLLLNGIIIQSDHMDIYQLLELLLSESRMLDRLSALGIRSDAYSSLLAMSVHSPESKEVVIDVRGKEVVFLNDLEKDRVYRSWAKSLTEFLRPTYPGMLRQIARNVFNIVFMLDPLSPSGHELLEYVKLFLDHLIPARFGLLLVPDPQDEVGIAVCQGFSFIAAKISPREGLRWIIKTQELSSTLHVNVTVDDISKLFLKLFSKALGKLSVGDVFSDEWDLYRKEASAFFSAKGFTSLPQVLVNGVQLDLEEDLETSIVTRLHHQTYEVQQALFTHRLKDKDDVYNFFLNKQNVLTRFNSHVLAKSKVFDLSYNEHSEGQLTGSVSKSLHYVYRAESEFTIKELTVWMAVNLSTSQGRKLVLDAIHYSESSELVRVGIVHNSGESISLVARAVQAILLSHLPVSSVIVFLEALLTLPDPVEMTQIISMAPSHGISPDKIRKLLFSDEVNSSIANHAIFCSTVLRLKDRENAMLSNGKLIGPFSEREVFSHADWSMLERMESDSYASNLATTVGSLAIKNLSPDDDTASYRSDLVMKLASLLRNQPRRNRLSQLPTLSSQYSALHLTPLDSELPLFMVAILDPLSPDTQQFSAILQSLRVALSLDLTLYLNPVAKLSQMPITSFYRYVLEPELSFGEDGALQDNVVAIFSDLPTSPLFTLSLDVPHSWLVEPVFSPYDLDNIHLAQVGDGSIHAEFTLEHILVEGQCFDVHSDQPTPGLEYVLGSSSHPDLFDTVVMANLGYFQLKAGPGAWFLRLREGRSMDIYSIHRLVHTQSLKSNGVVLSSYSGGDHSGSMEELLDNKVSINVRSFRGFGVVLKVSKRPGMEEASLLTDEMSEEKSTSDDDSGDSNNLWNTFSRFLHTPGADGGKETTVTTNETINIFSIASGHLYERFLRIMMLSVLKHTKNPVKFWFLKNYLSPTFKEFIPYMAVHYGFEFELVEYKWPRWLHAQTQKQRIIWGYKILFLDVLFPLSVKKIVFVDADQIIRTDLKELLEIPLDGAPYAYTPFCNSRSDMEGFRFWEKGYWKSHLGNRRYHISALYVVDLVSFRQLAAGDRLRGQYQALSQDPNSLSNLDQDLPNNMIHSVPIKSLPQEWLWCETWCSQESKAQAKTIDLCNNPLTKEPKLQSAMRIVPEWTDYDNEIKSLWEKFADNHTHHAPKTHDHIEL